MDARLIHLFSSPFVWGKADCCLTVADGLVSMGLPDPMAPYRGRYDSERAALRLFAQEGGLEAVVVARMAACGYGPGDLAGLVETDIGPTACLRIGRWWWAKSITGAQAYDDACVTHRWGPPCHKQSR